MAVSIPVDEAARLDALYQYQILDTPPEEALDALTRLAAIVCETPVALISLLDADRHWFKSSVGLEAKEATRDNSFCAYAVMQREVFIVADASRDERFAGNPLVSAKPGVRFYAGAPLATPTGHTLGALCVMDYVPRELTPGQLQALRGLADQVVTLFELRRANLEQAQTINRLELILNAAGEGIYCLDADGCATFVNTAGARLLGWGAQELLGKCIHDTAHHSYPDGNSYPREDCPIYAAFRNGRVHQGDDQVFWRKDGTSFPAWYTSTPIMREGIPTGSVVVFNDITEYKRSQQELKRLKFVSDNAADPYFVTGREGEFLYVNRVACEMLGYAKRELLGMQVCDVDAAYAGPTHRELFDRAQRQRIPPFESEHRRKDGSTLPVEITVTGVTFDGVAYVLRVVRDITERKQAKDALQQGEERYRSLVMATAAIVWTAAAAGIIVEKLPSWEAFTGQQFDDYKGSGWLNAVHPDDRPHTVQAWNRALKNQTPIEIEDRLLHRDGLYRHMLVRGVPVFDARGCLREWIGTCSDITERKYAEQRLNQLANYDALTDLPNRGLAMERLSQALAVTTAQTGKTAVLFVDLDGFKRINDTLGHDVGDLLLKAVAQQLTACVRAGDTVARLGGDEFVVILANIERIADVNQIVQRILQSLSQPLELAGHELFITTSIGISLYPRDGDNPLMLLKNADTAMYLAKERGRNQFQYYSTAIGAKTSQRLLVENALRHALAQDEFILHYQPQIDLEAARIDTVEALIRWRRPGSDTLVPPAEFIPIAEENGLIVPIGQWVLHAACAQSQRWQTQGLGRIHMAVNVSARQFDRSDMKKTVRDTLSATGLDPNCLELELTESILHTAHAGRVLHALKKIGVKIAIDDFGTGYSSLSYLKRFSIDKLKIDRSFMQGVPGDPDNASIIGAIIAMAHSLKLKVTAEGVETIEQREFLHARHCDAIQGYLLSVPLCADGMTELLRLQT